MTRVLTEGGPLPHVGAETGIARPTLTKWVHCYRINNPQALDVHSSTPSRRPTRTRQRLRRSGSSPACSSLLMRSPGSSV
nr:hypothetical protein [Kocuria atrinae]